jgi:hypothetical protein
MQKHEGPPKDGPSWNAASLLDRASTADEVDQEHHHRDNEQEVDEAAGYMEDSPPQQPGHQQDNRKPYQHGETLQ